MTENVKQALRRMEPKTAARIANELNVSVRGVKTVLGHLIQDGLAMPTASGYVRVG